MDLARDQYAVYRLDEEHDVIELEWLETTTSMTEDDFREGLSRLANYAEEHPASNLLIDVRRFRYTPAPDNLEWRDREIIPRYNAAGVRRQAFLLPPGAKEGFSKMPQGNAEFEYGFFESAAEAEAWVREPEA